jgi:hypothetical protein
MYSTGRRSDTKTCVRISTALRAACGSDEACARNVSLDFSYHCYAGVYSTGTETKDLGPCFLPVKDRTNHEQVARAVAPKRQNARPGTGSQPGVFILISVGAGYRIRTGDVQLGKVDEYPAPTALTTV